MKELEQNVTQWAQERGIFDNATPLTQHDKTIEEVIELRDSLVKLELNKSNLDYFHQAMDGIGDTIITLIIITKMLGTNIGACVNMSWGEIKDRKGKMIDGKFVKEQGNRE